MRSEATYKIVICMSIYTYMHCYAKHKEYIQDLRKRGDLVSSLRLSLFLPGLIRIVVKMSFCKIWVIWKTCWCLRDFKCTCISLTCTITYTYENTWIKMHRNSIQHTNTSMYCKSYRLRQWDIWWEKILQEIWVEHTLCMGWKVGGRFGKCDTWWVTV